MVFSGLVLAAGRSERMGRDKALLVSTGESWWRQRVAVLRAAGATDVWLSVRADQTWWQGPAAHAVEGCVTDPLPNAGPLGGVVAGLQAMRGTHLAVVAVDLPQLPVAWFSGLARVCRPDVGAAGFSVHHENRRWEPLAAIYPRSALTVADARLARGEHSLQGLLDDLEQSGAIRGHRISSDEVDWLKNANTPTDLGASPGPFSAPA